MRQAKVLFNGEEAGHIVQHDNGHFTFRYTDSWFKNDSKPPISPTLPKSKQETYAKHLFPFFYNMLPEGVNKSVICSANRIDPDDDFGLILTTACHDNIGAVSLSKIQTNVDS